MKFSLGTSLPPLRSTEIKADHGNDVNDSTKGQQQ
jgi:hypothetical protein